METAATPPQGFFGTRVGVWGGGSQRETKEGVQVSRTNEKNETETRQVTKKAQKGRQKKKKKRNRRKTKKKWKKQEVVEEEGMPKKKKEERGRVQTYKNVTWCLGECREEKASYVTVREARMVTLADKVSSHKFPININFLCAREWVMSHTSHRLPTPWMA